MRCGRVISPTPLFSIHILKPCFQNSPHHIGTAVSILPVAKSTPRNKKSSFRKCSSQQDTRYEMKITECRITYLLFRKYSTYKGLPHNPRWTSYTNLQIWKFLRADSPFPLFAIIKSVS
ncbi:hypothetical protein QQG55_41480 [Brugia pahangi]